MTIKETLTILATDNSKKVINSKSHHLPYECPPFSNPVEFFAKVVDGFEAKRRRNHNPMDEILKEKVNDRKFTIAINPVIRFEYPQLWTYELCD